MASSVLRMPRALVQSLAFLLICPHDVFARGGGGGWVAR